MHRHVRWEMGIHGAHRLRRITENRCPGIEVDDLPGGVDASIGAPRTDNSDRLTGDLRQRPFELGLDGSGLLASARTAPRLQLKAGEVRPVVLDDGQKAHGGQALWVTLDTRSPETRLAAGRRHGVLAGTIQELDLSEPGTVALAEADAGDAGVPARPLGVARRHHGEELCDRRWVG